MRVVVAVPCHQDEPGVASTVADITRDTAGMADARIVVCVNGDAPEISPAASQLRFEKAPEGTLSDRSCVVFVDRASKPAAWNRLRAESADITVFCDADVHIEPGSIPALVDALDESPDAVIATAAQTPRPPPPPSAAGRVAAVPFRLGWGGVAGTLYAAQTAWLPAMPEDVLLDDAWLWAQAASRGPGSLVHVPGAMATFTLAGTWRDLWRQRLRAEAGKRQLRSWGLPLAPQPEGGRPSLSTLRAYPPSEWPAVAALAAIKLAAATWSRLHPPRWTQSVSTKSGPREDLRHTFDSVAEAYDRARPHYPDELIDGVVQLSGLTPGDRVLEVGCGTGKATVAIAQRGLDVTGIELGRGLASVARRNLAAYPDARVIESAFESWSPGANSFDAVIAATSWHWIDPAVRCRKAADLLRLGGHIAIWTTNHVFPEDGDPFFVEIQDVYDEIGEGRPSSDINLPRPGQLKDHRGELEASGCFEDIEVRHFDWELIYSVDEYIALLDTFSGHIAMPPGKRQHLYDEIRRRLAARPDQPLHRHWGAALTVALRSDCLSG